MAAFPRRRLPVTRRLLPALCAALASSRAFLPSAQRSSHCLQARLPSAGRALSNCPGSGFAPRAAELSVLLLPLPAAAEASGEDYGGALVAYGHYLSLLISAICLTVERLTIKANMTREEETQIVTADAVYGLSGLLVVFTGYLRVAQYGKGWDFYQHEPLFWVKVTLVAITGACSFFVTTVLVKRGFAQRDAGDVAIAPVSPKLAARMTSIINAELLALCSIPLAATFMARGVWYAEWLPWQAGAAPAVLALGGLGYRYIKEALEWADGEAVDMRESVSSS